MTVTTNSSLAMLPDSYLAANATVDKFLNDWLTHSKDGVSLLDSHAKQGSTATQLQKYYTQLINPTHSRYELVAYRKVSDAEYQFHVWMYGRIPGTYGPNGRRPAPETITVMKRNNKWDIDNLPKVH